MAKTAPTLQPIVVPMAAPAMPSLGNGPQPNTSEGASAMLIALATQSTRMAIAASPLLRNTELARNNITTLALQPSMMRENVMLRSTPSEPPMIRSRLGAANDKMTPNVTAPAKPD